jgi:hypothetical protein
MKIACKSYNSHQGKGRNAPGSTLLLLLALATFAARAQSPLSFELQPSVFPDGPVHALALDTAQGRLFFGGDFQYVGPLTPFGAALPLAGSAEPAQADSRFPFPNGTVLAAEADGAGGWFLGGTFTALGDSLRSHIAHLDSSGAVTSRFSGGKGFSGAVRALELKDSTLYVGGEFLAFGKAGSFRSYGAVLDRQSAETAAFPQPNGPVRCAVPDGKGGWFIGGEFTQVDGQPRAFIAHLDSSGALSDWNPGTNSTVRAMLLLDSTLYCGGFFTTASGQARLRLAAFHARSGALLDWNPQANNAVYCLAAQDSFIYAGGLFTEVGSALRNRLAALDRMSGAAGSFNPNLNGAPYAIVPTDSITYVGGVFTTASGVSRNRLAAFERGSGALLPWNPNASSGVYSLLAADSLIYAAGLFTQVGGESRAYLAALDAGSGMPSDFNPSADQFIWSLARSGDTLYAGGAFERIGPVVRRRVAALNRHSGALLDWGSASRRHLVHSGPTGTAVLCGRCLYPDRWLIPALPGSARCTQRPAQQLESRTQCPGKRHAEPGRVRACRGKFQRCGRANLQPPRAAVPSYGCCAQWQSSPERRSVEPGCRQQQVLCRRRVHPGGKCRTQSPGGLFAQRCRSAALEPQRQRRGAGPVHNAHWPGGRRQLYPGCRSDAQPDCRTGASKWLAAGFQSFSQ